MSARDAALNMGRGNPEDLSHAFGVREIEPIRTENVKIPQINKIIKKYFFSSMENTDFLAIST